MKTILLATDFSANSKHAARYGYDLAQQIKANVLLCNAIMVPEISQAGMVIWPMEEHDILLKESSDELIQLKNELEQSNSLTGFKPKINWTNDSGLVTDVIKNTVAHQETDMIVIGTHSGGGLSQFLVGNHAHKLIGCTPKPLLIVAAETSFKPIQKIAFATDFVHFDRDLKLIYELIDLAKLLGSEILLAHIVTEHHDAETLRKSLSDCLLNLSNNADYPNIYYRLISSDHIEKGLNWLCEFGQVDMLAMVHQPRTPIAEIFKASLTKKMADHIRIPLLVFPCETN
jgi:nucleotide-binding universal stress UspA family protein